MTTQTDFWQKLEQNTEYKTRQSEKHQMAEVRKIIQNSPK